jgi:hypothetical protein
MSNTQTLATMRTRVRRRADMENSNFISDAELDQYINDSLSELYDLFVVEYEEYVIQKLDTTITGEVEYDIVTDFGIDNFMKIAGIDLKTSGRTINMQRFMFPERNTMQDMPVVSASFEYNIQYAVLGNTIKFTNDQANSNNDITIWFVPSFVPMLETDFVDDVAPFLAPGWEEFAVLDSAIKCLLKEESDTKALEREKSQLTKRIRSIAMNRDTGSPYRVVDVNRSSNAEWSYDI